MKLIDKSALVVEIERRIKVLQDHPMENHKTICHLDSLKQSLDTLEVKKVDLDREATHYLLHKHLSPLNEIMHKADLKLEMQYHKDIENAFKSGFELSLKVAQKEE